MNPLLRSALLLTLILGLTPRSLQAQDTSPRAPVVESKADAGRASASQYQAIDGVLHGESVPPSQTRFLYGVPITESGNAFSRSLSIGSTAVSSRDIDRVLKRLPPMASPVRIPHAARWARAPFDGTFDDGREAMCRTPTPYKIYRTNRSQPGDAPIAPRIASFATMRKMQDSISNDVAALERFHPWQPAACNVNFEQFASFDSSAEGQAYLAAWKAEQPRPLDELAFAFGLSGPSLIDLQRAFLSEFQALERDIAVLPNAPTRRLSAAFSRLAKGARAAPDKESAARMQSALMRYRQGWLQPSCREILYVTGTVPSEPYIFRENLPSEASLHVLLGIWKLLTSDPFSPRLDNERVVAGDRAVTSIQYLIDHYSSPDPEPDKYILSDLSVFRLIAGHEEESKLSKFTSLSLLAGVAASSDQSQPHGAPDRYEFDPRRWRLIVEYRKHRLIDRFYREYHGELFSPAISSQLRLTELKERIWANVALARELGRPAEWPAEPPRFAREGIEENTTGRTNDRTPFLRWYDRELVDSVELLSSERPLLNGVWSDTLGLRFVGDLDGMEWAIYNDTIAELVHVIDTEIARIQFAAGYAELTDTLSALNKADRNQPELVFGGEPFRLEECAPSAAGSSFTAGTLIARIQPAFRHLIEVDLDVDDPLLEALSEQSRVSVVLTSLVGRPSEVAPLVSTSSADPVSAFIAQRWAAAARFEGRVSSISNDGSATHVELEVLSVPEQDTIMLGNSALDLMRFPGVQTGGGSHRLSLQGGILGNIERATAIIMPRSAVDRARMRAAIEARAL